MQKSQNDIKSLDYQIIRKELQLIEVPTSDEMKNEIFSDDQPSNQNPNKFPEQT